MKRVKLPYTDISVSRLSFGTASLHHLATPGRRHALLQMALDCGITHFDTSPYYGFGLSECDLGQFLRRRRDRATIATKVGIYPPNGVPEMLAAVWAWKAIGRFFPRVSRPIVDWSVAAATAGIESSLRRLRTTYVDILLLHEPISWLVDSDECLGWLERCRQQGKCRCWGLAGPVDLLEPWMRASHGLAQVLQVRDTLDGKEADVLTSYQRPWQLTYGYFASAAERGADVDTQSIVAGALRRNQTGSVIFSSRSSDRILAIARAAEAMSQ